ncbi:MAG: YgaP family membrane protein [Leptospirales bacterium]
MTVNEGTADRVIRVVAGLALISLVFVGPKTQWGWIGIVLLVTGLVGRCGIYALLGISTCPLKANVKKS